MQKFKGRKRHVISLSKLGWFSDHGLSIKIEDAVKESQLGKVVRVNAVVSSTGKFGEIIQGISWNCVRVYRYFLAGSEIPQSREFFAWSSKGKQLHGQVSVKLKTKIETFLNDPYICPNCCSENIEGNSAEDTHRCLSCGHSF